MAETAGLPAAGKTLWINKKSLMTDKK